MMNDLPPFNTNPNDRNNFSCPKCNHNKKGCTYHKRESPEHHRDEKTGEESYIQREWMVWECSQCQFNWLTRVYEG